MALQRGRASRIDLPIITLFVAVVAAAIVVLNAVFGVGSGVSLTEIVPDPAGAMPF
jgi:hypothetical protein